MADAQLATLTDSGTVSPTSDLLQNMSDSERQNWKMTGELPKAEVETPKEEPAPSPEPEVPEEPKVEPPPEEKPEVKMTGAEKRIKQLLAKNKELQAQLEARPEPKKAEAKPEAAAAVPPKPTVNDKNSDGSPKYVTYEEFLDARDAWNESRTQERIELALKSDREAQSKAQKQAEIQKQNESIEAEWNKRVAEATKRHPDFPEVALAKEVVDSIPKGSAIDAFILESGQGPEVLYHFGQNPDELERIAALGPIGQVRELVKIELGLTSTTPSPVKKTTSAPAPPAELAAKATVPADEAQAALQRGDFAAYRRAANAREIASRKG